MRALLLILLCAAACRSRPLYQAPWGAGAEQTYRMRLADDERVAEEDRALWMCEVASAALWAGDEAGAFRALDDASRVLGTLESTPAEDRRAILGEEATKTWKGDPYERCMASLYKGLLYWRAGDLDNASACFKAGLLADAWSAEGESQEDFAALSFLLGWVSALRGKEEQARFSFREAAAHCPGNPYLQDPQPLRDNVLIVADIGLGPEKYASGTGDHMVRFARRPHPDHGIEVLVDGVPEGRSAMATDLFHQAVTRGKRVLDGIRKGKAVFKAGTFVGGAVLLHEGQYRRKKELVAAGAGLLLLSALTQAQADTRHWSSLPAEVHVLPLRIPPGRHRLEVRALDARGHPLPGWSRTFEVDVPERPGTLYWFKTGPGRTISGLLDPAERNP